MPKLIKDWGELSKEISKDGKFKIELEEICGAWIEPIQETKETLNEKYWETHKYLSSHTFYGKHYRESTRILQKFGFDIEIDNWDKEDK